MSYETPTQSDKESLIQFHIDLDDHQDRDSDKNITIDLIETDFDRFLNTANHTKDYSAPFPPIPRNEFTDMSVKERTEKIKTISKNRIQEYMESAALLSFLHPVKLEDIEGLNQDKEHLREKVINERLSDQTKMEDFNY